MQRIVKSIHRIVIIFALLAFPYSSFFNSAIAKPIKSSSIEVIDGDTIRYSKKEWRLVGFDAPEITSTRRRVKLEEKKLGVAAADRLQQLINSGGILELEPEPCACSRSKSKKQCNYGRSCATLNLDGKNVGLILISEGHARPFICSDTRCPKQLPWP